MLLAFFLLSSGLFLAGRATATVAPTAPADIMFETTSPYYQPHVAIVSAGTPVRWVNVTASHHTVRHDGCATDGPCAFQSIAVPPDSNFLIAPLPPGRYSYHCELHPVMRGTLVILESRTPSADVTTPASVSAEAHGTAAADH
jgi:plastocyanin